MAHPERFSDILTHVLSVALAAGVVAFAAYKVVKLNGMENPPADMGLNFPPSKRWIVMNGAPASDPIITETLAPSAGNAAAGRSAHPGRPGMGTARSYELLTVVDGVAFVEVSLARGNTLVPVTVGSLLPGGLQVEAIERRGSRWVLVAGRLKLEQVTRPLQ